MLIISDEIYRDLVHYRSRTLHRKVSDAVAQVFTGAGVPVPAPQAGFYLYPDFGRYRDHLRRA